MNKGLKHIIIRSFLSVMIIFSLLFSSFSFRINYHSCKKENKTYASLFNFNNVRNHSDDAQHNCCSEHNTNCHSTCRVADNHNHQNNIKSNHTFSAEQLESSCCTESDIEKSILLTSILDYSKIQFNKLILLSKLSPFFENTISKKVDNTTKTQLKNIPPLINFLITFIKFHNFNSNYKEDFISIY